MCDTAQLSTAHETQQQGEARADVAIWLCCRVQCFAAASALTIAWLLEYAIHHVVVEADAAALQVTSHVTLQVRLPLLMMLG